MIFLYHYELSDAIQGVAPLPFHPSTNAPRAVSTERRRRAEQRSGLARPREDVAAHLVPQIRDILMARAHAVWLQDTRTRHAASRKNPNLRISEHSGRPRVEARLKPRRRKGLGSGRTPRGWAGGGGGRAGGTMSKLLSWANDLLEAVDSTAAQVRQETQEWREEEAREAAEAEALAAAERDEAVRSWNSRYQQAQGGEEPPEADGATGGERIPAAREEVPERGGTDAGGGQGNDGHGGQGGGEGAEGVGWEGRARPAGTPSALGSPAAAKGGGTRTAGVVPRSREAYRRREAAAAAREGALQGPAGVTPVKGDASAGGEGAGEGGDDVGLSRAALAERVEELEREAGRLREDAGAAAELYARELAGLRQQELDATLRVDQKSADVMEVRRTAQLREAALEAAMTAQARELASARREVDERERRADAARRRADAAEVALARERGGTAREAGAREELQREMVALVTALRDELVEKEEEVRGLGAQLAAREEERSALGRRAADAEARWSRADAELRARGPSAGPGAPDALVRDLAATIEALAAKQRAVEELTTDRHAMQLRVEALGAALSEAQARVHALQSGAAARDGGGGVDGGLRGMSRRAGAAGVSGGGGGLPSRRAAAEGLLPYRSELSHLVRDLPEPVAKALVAVDRAALGALKLLRIHPVPRLLLFAYICVLNLWVFFGLSLFIEHAHGGGGHGHGHGPASASAAEAAAAVARSERVVGQHPVPHAF